MISNVADVSVAQPVDGTVQRRRRGKNKPKHDMVHIVLDRRVLEKVKELIFVGPYTRYEIISATEAVVR